MFPTKNPLPCQGRLNTWNFTLDRAFETARHFKHTTGL